MSLKLQSLSFISVKDSDMKENATFKSMSYNFKSLLSVLVKNNERKNVTFKYMSYN